MKSVIAAAAALLFSLLTAAVSPPAARPWRRPPGTWHILALSISGTAITASVDGQQAASLTDATLTHGMPGIETGGWYPAHVSNLVVTTP